MCLELKNRKVTFAPDTERTLLTLPLKGESFHWDYRAMIGKSSSLRTCLGVSSEARTYLYILDSDERQVLLYQGKPPSLTEHITWRRIYVER